MTVYAIATLNIHDRDEYARYEEGFLEIFDRYKGRILAVDEAPRLLEGEWSHTRTVLLEFPNEKELLAWYESDAYQELLQHRLAASSGDVVLLEGLPAAPSRSS